MWKEWTICILSIFFVLAVSAQNSSFEIKQVSTEKIEITPGSTSNIAIKLTNKSEELQEISLQIINPDGWKCFSSLKAIKVLPLKPSLKILSFSIPDAFQSGNFQITIEAIDKTNLKLAELNIPVQVKPKYELGIKFIGGPEYVFSNDTFSVQFLLQNLSNIKASVTAELKSVGETEKMYFNLQPDSSILINRTITAEKGILKYTKKDISLAAFINDQPEVRESIHHYYNILPSGKIKFDPYLRFPINVSTLFVTDNPRGERLSALMVDVSGNGYIDNKNEKAVNFRFRGPDRRGKPLYGINDEYYIEYKSKSTRIMVGDNTYQLSYLTEYSRYGRGARIEKQFNKFNFGSFINYPRFYPKIKQEISLYGSYLTKDKIQINAGYLHKLYQSGGSSSLYTMNGWFSPFKWSNLEWEYAIGSFNKELKQAFKSEIKLTFKPLRIQYNYTLTEKDYPGYFSDTRYMLGTGILNLTKKMNLGVNYSYIHQNIALDTILSNNAPFTENLIFSLNYRILKNAGMSVSYSKRSREDKMVPKKFYYDENSMRLILNSRLKRFGFDIMGEYGKTNNLLNETNDDLSDLYRGRLMLGYDIPQRLGLNLFLSYQASNRYIIGNQRTWFYGGSVNANLGEKLDATLNYQNNFNIEDFYLDRSILDLHLNYKINKNNSFDFSVRHNLVRNTLDVKELAFVVKYVRTLNIPVAKKENIGKLKGKVNNLGVKTVEGIVLSIGADKAVTDSKGNFSFPILESGSYFLTIDYSIAGVGAIPDKPGPYKVDILSGEETNFDITMTLASRITGSLVIEKEVSEKDKSFAGIREQLGKLIIEAKNGDEVFRVFSDEEGNFSFESLRPGPWVVKVYDRGIPSEYQLSTDIFNLVLVSGHTEHIDVKIIEKRRRIRFQKTYDNKIDIKQDPTLKPQKPIASVIKKQEPKADQSQKPESETIKTNTKAIADTIVSITDIRKSTSIEKPKEQSEKIKNETPKSINSPTGTIEYRIQIGAQPGKKIPVNWLSKTYNLNESINEDFYNNNYIYTVGSFDNIDDAQEYKFSLRKNNNIKGAFVVTFVDGKRYDIIDSSVSKPISLVKPKPTKPKNEVEYRVQIAANPGKELSIPELVKLYKITLPVDESLFNGNYVYTVGAFKTREEAQKLRNDIAQKNNINGAFIVTFRDGKRFNQ